MALELPKFGSKNKTEKKTAPKNDTMLKVMDFFDKNPIMKIIIPVVLFLILAGVLLVLIFGDGVLTNDHTTGSTDIQSNSNQVEILGNNLIKDKEIVELIESDPLSEDVLASAKYKAYSSGSSGLKVAMIEIGSMGDTFSLSKGETIGSWELVEITKEYVVFKAGEITKKLDLTNK